MATVAAGMTMSLDGLVADPHGSVGRLYSDLRELRGTDYEVGARTTLSFRVVRAA
jgi:hypothetical protein